MIFKYIKNMNKIYFNFQLSFNIYFSNNLLEIINYYFIIKTI